jgi:AcrR family transcriptional regulator
MKPSAREANSIKIRNLLIDACEGLMAQMPIEAIRVNHIVEAAGVAKGSFYNHFSDKDTLATAVAASIREEVEELVATKNRDLSDPLSNIARGICCHALIARNNPARALILLRHHELATSGSYRLNKTIQEDVDKGISIGKISPICKDVGIIHVMGVAFFLMARTLETSPPPAKFNKLITESLEVLFRGLGASKNEANNIALDAVQSVMTE